MKLSFTTLGCPDWTLEQIAARAKEYGYDGIELRTHGDGNHLSPDAPPEEVQRVAKLFSDAGVPVFSIMGYCTFAHVEDAKVAENQALLRKLIGIAQNMGAPFVRTFCGRVPPGSDVTAMAARIGEALKPLAEEAAARHVKIAMETHDDWCAAEKLRQILKIVKNPAGLGIVYDIFNAFSARIEPWDVTYRKIKGDLAYCHLKDGYAGPDGKYRYVMMGAGDLPLAKIIRKLKQDHFEGFLSYEWEKKWIPELESPERVFPHFAYKVRQLWNEL